MGTFQLRIRRDLHFLVGVLAIAGVLALLEDGRLADSPGAHGVGRTKGRGGRVRRAACRLPYHESNRIGPSDYADRIARRVLS